MYKKSLYRLLTVVGALYEEGVEPPYTTRQLIDKRDYLGIDLGNPWDWMIEGALRGNLFYLGKKGYLRIVKRHGRVLVYPTSHTFLHPDEVEGELYLPDSRSNRVVLLPESKLHRILSHLKGKTEGSRRVGIEKGANVSFKHSAGPLQALLVAGLIERPKRGVYRITDTGKEALGTLDSGKKTSVGEEKMDPGWRGYFGTHTW